MATDSCRASLGLDGRGARPHTTVPTEPLADRRILAWAGFHKCGPALECATFDSLLGCLRAPRARHLPDSRISCENEFAGAERSLLEILSIGGEDLPAGHFLTKHLNGAHVGEGSPQTLVVLLGGGEPYPVVCRLARFVFVPEDEDDLVFHIDCQAAEHRVSSRRQGSKRIEYKLMRHR